MDQIFERLERLVRAWTNLSGDGSASPSSPGAYAQRSSRSTSSGDPDLDAAMAELDDYLDTSKTETERREADEAARARSRAQAEADHRTRSGGSGTYSGSGSQSYDRTTSSVIEDAYRYLGVAPYAPFAEVRSSYRRLLLKYHPDRNSGTPEMLKRATETSSRINAAYQIIEAHEATKASR